jgi:ankyrin repeat protein
VEFCRYLIKNGAYVNTVCSNNETATHMAFKSNSIELVLLFYENGADFSVKNINGYFSNFN